MGAIYYLNGAYLSEEDAKIHVTDLGVLRGFGVFDYLRTYAGKPFHLWDHLLRLKYSADQIGLHIPNSLEEIEKIIYTLLEKNGFKESGVKIVVTGGFSPDQMMPEQNSSLMVLIYPFKPFPDHFYEKGIKVISTPLARLIPSAKTTQYIPAIMAMKKARQQDAYEALYLNSKEEILEATTSNFFVIKDGKILTPASDEILFGITRAVILKLEPRCEIRPIFYRDLVEVDEAFLAASNKEIMPVVQVDGIKIGTGRVGPQTKKVIERFREYAYRGPWGTLEIDRYA
jgi:branched-chain amino acid aminotransferase